MSAPARGTYSRLATLPVNIERVEKKATDIDHVAHELYLAGTRRSPITNQLWHFMVDPTLSEERALYRRLARRALEYFGQRRTR